MDFQVDTSDPTRITTDFDHHDPELRYALHEGYDQLRSACPVVHSTNHGGYVLLTSREAVANAASLPNTFSSDHDVTGARKGYGGTCIPGTPFEFGFTEQDPPRTTKVRRILNSYFSPSTVEGWKPMIRDVTTAVIDRVIEDGSCDLVDDIGSAAPATIAMVILDLPVEHWKLCADAMHHLLTAVKGSPLEEQAGREMAAVMDILREAIAERMRPGNEGTDPISALCRAEIDGERMGPDELLGNAMLLVAGGVETTTSLLGSSFVWLDQHHDERDRLRAESDRIALACEEFLRVFAPVTGSGRTASHDVDFMGQRIAADTPVLLTWAAANMDPEEFDDPHEVRLDRWPNRHSSFGLGIHRCIGSNFARTQYRIIVEEVLKRMPDYSIDHSKAEPYPSVAVNRGYVSLPTTFTPGPKLGSSIVL